MPSTFMIIDGNNLLMRCIKAMEHSGLRNGESWQTGPLTAFIGALGRFVRTQEPEHLVVCWDAGPSKRRKELFPDYKAARGERDPEHEERRETAFGMTKAFLRLAKIPQTAAEGYEADDVVAAYWAQTRPDQFWIGDEEDLPYKTIIVSGDKDFFQLLDMGTYQLRPDNAGSYELWDRDRVEREYGFAPRMMPSFMALVGDQSDGIPGVRGIGPKKALKGLQEADWDLESVPALKDPEKLADACLSYLLVDLRHPSGHPDVPPIPRFEPLTPADLSKCLDLVTFLRSLEMETILNRFYTGTLWR